MKIPAITGWHWLKQGFALFRKQPAALITLLFANILVSVTISSLPWIGTPLVSLLIPAFSMSFMKACVLIDNGVRVTPAVLLTGFRKPAFPALAKVGLIYVGVAVMLTAILHFSLDPAVLKQMDGVADPKDMPEGAASIAMTVLLVVALQMATLMALAFAAPLTYWQKMGPGKATFYSFFAVVRNLRAFLVMLLSWCGLIMGLVWLLPMLFGTGYAVRVMMLWMSFLFALLLQCAFYAAYRHIFGKPEEAAATVSLKK
ncbi:MAG TPA: BPSS1780 family membrane protein [Telluria sp.]